MEFMNRSSRPSQPASSPAANQVNTPASPGHGHKKTVKDMVGLRLASVVLLFAATVLVVALVWSVVLGSPTNESRHIDKDRLQAVFLNGGQVYFGKVTDLNSDFLRLRDIYYLRVNQQVQPGQQASANDISLVKLGCELHGPQDVMLINREQVVFWENLKDDGQVAKAVAQYKEDNPNGQNCEQQSQQSTPSSTTTPSQNEEDQ